MDNTEPNDGFIYRGRGLLQLTGKESYILVTKNIRQWKAEAPDFRQVPDEAFSLQWCVHAAAAEWDASKCNALADLDSIRRVTRAINGGLHGLAERQEWLRRTKNIW